MRVAQIAIAASAWLVAWAPVAAGPGTLAVRSETVIPLSTPHLRGQLVHARFSMFGVPVRGAFETRRVGADGAQDVTAAVRPLGEPQFQPSERRIEPEDLPALVAAALGMPADAEFESSPALVYLLVMERPVLAWEVQLPLASRPEPTRRTVWLSAMTGRVLAEEEQVRSARARVFAENPAITPDAITVELTGITTTGPGVPLEGERVVSLNCLTEEPTEVAPYHEDGECFPAHRVFSDDAGDFFVRLPDVVEVTDNVQPEDRYAELSMYYHAERFLERMREFGVEQFKCETATMLANFRTLEPEGELPYTPLNNAFYTNQCNPEKGPTMLFGQGVAVDFGYDGDVVYHELGHGMVAMLAPDGLAGAQQRPEASSPDAGSLNEAIADYFAFLMTDDPNLAEYVGRFWPGSGRAQIRSGENQKRCPDDITGEVHNDGEPFVAALWATRIRVGPIFDEIVLESVTRLPKAASLEDGAHAVLAAAADFRALGDLDQNGYEVLERSMAARGLLDCPRVIEDPSVVLTGRAMHLRKLTPAVQPFWPGPMQLHYVVPPGQRAAEVEFTLRSRAGGPLSALVLVKEGSDPISFTYELVAVDDASDATGTASMVREVTRVGGDWDLELQPTPRGDGDYRVTLSSLRPGESLYVALVSTSTVDVTASGVVVRTPGYEPDEPATETDSGTGEGSGDGTEIVRATGPVTGGCGCQAGNEGRQGARWSGLWILIAIRRRR